MNPRGFASDNQAGVHPKILEALALENTGHCMSYGGDPTTNHCERLFQDFFGADTFSFPVFNGTAANVLALRTLIPAHQSILCADVSHLNQDECGAPEFFTGAKLIPVPSAQGKLTIEALDAHWIRQGDQHYSQPGAISITQPTEYGTVYSVEELGQLVQWAKRKKLKVHIDGARIANAVVSANTNFKAMFRDTGVDAISFGGTKNGLMFGECVLVFNKDHEQALRYIRKQSGQLPSKSRFVAIQFATYWKDDLWRKIAQHSLSMAQQLRLELSQHSQIQITQPTQSNAVFAMIPDEWFKPLRETAYFYVWDEKTWECRFMTSWDTQLSDIEKFGSKILSLKGSN